MCRTLASRPSCWPPPPSGPSSEPKPFRSFNQSYIRCYMYIIIVAKAVFLHVTFASLTPCFKSTHPHQTVWTETISNPISIRTNVPRIPFLSPPPSFLAVGFAVSFWGTQEEQGIWNTRAEPRDLVIKRVTLQTGKGLQREGIRDELLEWV